jgi:hypothetical protein
MSTAPAPPNARRLTSDEILRIARLDAEKAYRDLSPYRIRVTLSDERTGWQVDYELKDENAEGGGASYVIDPFSGAIVSKKYYQ